MDAASPVRPGRPRAAAGARGRDAPPTSGAPGRRRRGGRWAVARAPAGAGRAPLPGEFGNMSRIAHKPSNQQSPDPHPRADIVSHTLAKTPLAGGLDRGIAEARDALIARQSAQGYW